MGDSDEAFYAEAAREMRERGDWLTPYYNYETRFQKPVLYYWLIGGTYAVAGIGEAQARLWAALSGLGLALVTAAAGRRWRDDATGLLAGAIVATSFGYFSIGRLSLPDLPLAFFVTLTIYATLVGTLDDHPRATRWLALAGAAAGAAFLTKGPVGLVVAALAILPAWWIERRRLRVPLGGALAAAALAAAIGLPWYLAMFLEHGRAYMDSFFLGDNFERFATNRFNDPRPVWFYLPIVVGGMLPWTPLGAAAFPPLRAIVERRATASALALRLTMWALVPLLFFTASVGKQPRYILPILPPLALLLAMAIRRRVEANGDRRDAVLQVPAAVIALLLATQAALFYRARPLIVMVPTEFQLAAVSAIGLAALVALGGALARRSRLVPGAIAVAGALLLGGLQYRSVPCRSRSGAGHGSAGGPAPDQRPDHRDASCLRAQPDLLHRGEADRLAVGAACGGIPACARGSAVRHRCGRTRADRRVTPPQDTGPRRGPLLQRLRGEAPHAAGAGPGP